MNKKGTRALTSGFDLKICPKSKRSQVTIFIILAILIIGGVIVFFAVRGSLGSEEKVPPEVTPIVNFVQECMDTTLEDAVYNIAKQGGYYNIPEMNSIDVYGTGFSLYYMNSEKIAPSSDKVKKEIENSFSEHLEYCLNFSVFEEQGFQLSKKNLSVSSRIDEERVIIKMDFPLAIKKGETITKIDEWESAVNSNLKKFYEISGDILDSYSDNPGSVCLSCIEEVANREGVKIEARPLSGILEKDVILFSVSEEDSELKWIFAVEQ